MPQSSKNTLAGYSEKEKPAHTVARVAQVPPGKLILRRRGEARRNDCHSPAKIVAKTVATLSHEINNPLMAITAIVEVLLKEADRLPIEVAEKIRQVGDSAERIRRVTERLIDIDTLCFHQMLTGLTIDMDDLLKKILTPNQSETITSR